MNSQLARLSKSIHQMTCFLSNGETVIFPLPVYIFTPSIIKGVRQTGTIRLLSNSGFGFLYQFARKTRRGDLLMEDDIEEPLFRAGTDGTLLEDFRNVSGTERYPRSVLLWLARFISGTAGGPNKDSPIFELCHLAYAVDVLIASNNGVGRTLFFLGRDRAIPRTIQSYLDTEVNSDSDQARTYKDGIFIEYDDGQFHVKFGRMPALIALYEFLASMEDCTFYAELSDHLNGIGSQTKKVSLRSIKDATNNIASRLRQYRRTHLMWAANNEKFDRILPFLKARGDGTHLIIDDAAVLDFWTLHSRVRSLGATKPF